MTIIPVKKRKLADEVQDRLLAILQNGTMAPGDVLPSERQLMSDYKVGRPAIREAMQNLQRMGLVEIRHGERPRVAKPSVESMVGQMSQTMHHLLAHSEASMAHLKEARAKFESEMARIAATKRTETQIENLRDLIAQQAKVQNDAERFMFWDGEFHRTIASISGNPIFEALSHSLFQWLSDFHVNIVSQPGMEKLTIEEHTAIVDAIETGNQRTAAKTMSDHLNRANKLYHQRNRATK